MKRFRIRFILQEHAATVFCELCNQGFKTKEKLRVHKINKHLEDNQKPYVCSMCGKGEEISFINAIQQDLKLRGFWAKSKPCSSKTV